MTDIIWMTCCALHNLLLDKDRLLVDQNGNIGLFDYTYESDNIPFAIQTLNNWYMVWSI